MMPKRKRHLGEGSQNVILFCLVVSFVSFSCSAPSTPQPAALTAPADGPEIVSLEAARPVPGMDSAELDSWTEHIRLVFFGPAREEQKTELLVSLKEQDAVSLTPAFLNALLGKDMSDPTDVAGASALTTFWVEQVAFIPMFRLSTEPDPSKVEQRVYVLGLWRDWWETKAIDPTALVAYRDKLERAKQGLARDKLERSKKQGER